MKKLITISLIASTIIFLSVLALANMAESYMDAPMQEVNK